MTSRHSHARFRENQGLARFAFFQTLGDWAQAMEAGCIKEAQLASRKLAVLGDRLAAEDKFIELLRERQVETTASELVTCFCQYVDLLTESEPPRDQSEG